MKDSDGNNKHTRTAATWALGLCVLPVVWSIIALTRSPRTAAHPEPATRTGSHVVATVEAPSTTARRRPRRQAVRPASNAQVQAIDAGPNDVAWGALSTDWDKEAPDPDWSQNMMDYVDSLIGAVDGGRPELLKRAECRETVCKLVLTMSDPSTLHRLSETAIADGQRWTHEFEDEEGQRRLIVYVAREMGSRAVRRIP